MVKYPSAFFRMTVKTVPTPGVDALLKWSESLLSTQVTMVLHVGLFQKIGKNNGRHGEKNQTHI